MPVFSERSPTDAAIVVAVGTRPWHDLTGFSIAVTAQRRADEFITLLERHGAHTIHAPAIHIVHLVEDDQLRDVTQQVIDSPPDVLVVTTGFGFRSWIDAAHAWQLADTLVAVLRRLRIVARGPKSLGAVRQAGLHEEWSAQSESSNEVVTRLLAQGVTGRRVAVQLHGAGSELEPNADVCQPLVAAGAQVIAIPVYRWQQPDDLDPLDRLIAAITDSRVDAVAFTSAPAVASLVQRADTLDALPLLIAALNGPTIAACVGPVTATPLHRLGVPTIAPNRYRLGALARILIEQLPRRTPRLIAGGHELALRSNGVVVDGQWRPIPPSSMTILHQLIGADGRAVSTVDISRALHQEHTRSVHASIARLRTALGSPECIQTISGRGYRLNLDLPKA